MKICKQDKLSNFFDEELPDVDNDRAIAQVCISTRCIS